MSLTESNGQRLTTLGGLHLKPKGFQRPKLLLLLTYLALEHGKSREHLRTLFWAGATDVSASLRVALAQIRNALPDALEDSGSIVLTRIPCDAVDLQTALDASDWERAVNLYTGAFLDGIMLSEFGNELEEWVLTTREYLAGRVVEAHLRLAEQALGHNDLENVKHHANRAHKLPGAPPPEEDTLTRLHNILNAIKSPGAAELRREAAELGLELSTASTTVSVAPAPTNLPAPINSFIARETERRYLLETLKDPEARLVTVTGVGGIGKSRLALEVTRQLHRENRFKDGVFVAFLEVIESVDAVVSELLRVLQVPMESGQDPQSKLLEHLKHAEILLILDNLEHLIQFAGQLEQLLEACPKLKVLTTSRERLGLTAEWLLPLEGLPIPSSTEAKSDTPFGAVELFAARAKRQAPGFTLATQHDSVLEICRLVEGLPLAIELAAALIRAITLTELIEGIKQHPDVLDRAINDPHKRHDGMRAVFEQSWRLLTKVEQRTLAKMAVFRDGATRDAVLYVTEGTWGILTRLIEKSLIYMTINSRYSLHSILGQYISEKLYTEYSDNFYTQERHKDYFFEIFTNVGISEVIDVSSRNSFKDAENEFSNIQSALIYALNKLNFVSLKNLKNFAYFFDQKGRANEGFRLAEMIIERLESYENLTSTLDLSSAIALFYSHSAWLSFRIGKLDVARSRANLAIAKSQKLENDGLDALSDAQNVMCNILFFDGKFEDALEFGNKALKIAKSTLNLNREMMYLLNIANVKFEFGNFHEAEENYREILARSAKLSDKTHFLIANLNLANLILDSDEPSNLEKIKENLEDGLKIVQKYGFTLIEPYFHLNLSRIYVHFGDVPAAEKFALETLNLGVKWKNLTLEVLAEYTIGEINLRNNKISDANQQFYIAYQKSVKLENRLLVLRGLLHLGEIGIINKNYELSYQLFNMIFSFTVENSWYKREISRILNRNYLLFQFHHQEIDYKEFIIKISNHISLLNN